MLAKPEWRTQKHDYERYSTLEFHELAGGAADLATTPLWSRLLRLAPGRPTIVRGVSHVPVATSTGKADA